MMAMASISSIRRSVIRELLLGGLVGLVWLVILGWSLSFRGAWGVITVFFIIITVGFLSGVFGGGSSRGEWRRTGLGTPYLDSFSISTSPGEVAAAMVIIIGVVSGIVGMIIR